MGVEEDNVWLRNLIEQVASVLHIGSCGAEFGEDMDVIVEVGQVLIGEGLELLELSDRGAFG